MNIIFYFKKFVQFIKLRKFSFSQFPFRKLRLLKTRKIELSQKQPPVVSRKYSDLMKWQDQMLKEVGLNIPPGGWNTKNDKTSSEIEITFLRRKESNEKRDV